MRQEASLVGWRIALTRQAFKDARKLHAAGKRSQVDALIRILESNPFQNPPPYEKLVGDLAGAYSRRISIQHRLVYEVLTRERTVKIIRMWTHYE
jgi:toxin YoeB